MKPIDPRAALAGGSPELKEALESLHSRFVRGSAFSLIAGFLATVATRGGSYELVSNIIIGIIGACIGGFLASLLGLGYFSFVGSVVLAFVSGCVLIAILHAVAESTGRAIL